MNELLDTVKKEIDFAKREPCNSPAIEALIDAIDALVRAFELDLDNRRYDDE